VKAVRLRPYDEAIEPMRKTLALTAGLLLLVVGTLSAHDLFLKLPSYFLAPNSEATVALLNGTFEQSENIITRDRMLDVSVVDGSGTVRHPDTSQWRDEGKRAMLRFETGETGTYVLGVSTAPRTIELSAEDFNGYLKHDGVLDVLAARKENGTLDQPARERYSKHVKAIAQVGSERTQSFDRRLGYPIEIVPQQNPYALRTGDTLDVLVLRDGKPVADQIVYASHEDHHSHAEQGEHHEAVDTRTDTNGLAAIPLSHTGRWYVRLIHMEAVSGPSVDYESNWATLTFEVPSP
jgi:uncharacterized GH25 family protein